MGRYFGIGNTTKNHSVSSYWKANEWCDVHTVMHRYGWEHTDTIYTASYCDYYEFKFTKGKDGVITCIPIECMEKLFENEPSIKDALEVDLTKEIKLEDKKEIKIPINLGIEEYLCEGKLFDHVPVWKDGKCTVCGYSFDPKHVEEDKEKFNGVFHMN